MDNLKCTENIFSAFYLERSRKVIIISVINCSEAASKSLLAYKQKVFLRILAQVIAKNCHYFLFVMILKILILCNLTAFFKFQLYHTILVVVFNREYTNSNSFEEESSWPKNVVVPAEEKEGFCAFRLISKKICNVRYFYAW